MKKEELKIEVGGMYELSEKRKSDDIFRTIPLTYKNYKENYNFDYNFYSPTWIFNSEKELKFSNPEKHVVIVKKIHWLNYVFEKKSVPKCVVEASYIPIIEVYDFMKNQTFYVKPKILVECRDGKDLNEVLKNNIDTLKQKMLLKLRKK